MRSLSVSRRGCLAAAVMIWGCGGSEAPKIPLGHPDVGEIGRSEAEAPGAMGGEAKTALDSANMLFRAKDYGRALAQYRRSAGLAPTELAPLLGILMVTDVTKNARLADRRWRAFANSTERDLGRNVKRRDPWAHRAGRSPASPKKQEIGTT